MFDAFTITDERRLAVQAINSPVQCFMRTPKIGRHCIGVIQIGKGCAVVR